MQIQVLKIKVLLQLDLTVSCVQVLTKHQHKSIFMTWLIVLSVLLIVMII